MFAFYIISKNNFDKFGVQPEMTIGYYDRNKFEENLEEEKVSRMSPIEQESGTKMNRSIDLLKKLNHYLDR